MSKLEGRWTGVLDETYVSGRGALYQLRSYTVRSSGVDTSENAGISSEKAGENPARRKPKVS